MRIRNRKVPFPLSSLSPAPLSDPVVQLQLNRYEEDDTDEYFDPKPSDQHSKEPIRAVDGGAQQEKVLEENKSGEEGEKSNDSRKESLLSAEILGNMALQQTSSSSQPVTGKWFEGERAFPLKKKRGSNEKRSSVREEAKVEKDKKVKTKVNKKNNVEKEAKVQVDEEEESKEEIAETAITTASSSAKKKGRGGALMEGSRCSRVNGRGWRCCQQTLVGYSLCEHHLGKGRLRSMNSVRKRSLGASNGGTLGKKDGKPSSQKSPTPAFPSQDNKETELNIALDHQAVNDAQEDDNDEEEKPSTVNNAKKKMKLGVVKARSISSLLEQANRGGIAVAADSNE